MPYRDYYNVLGVGRKATQDEIKRAYRTLARRFHPDRNPNDPTAASRFRDIKEAYETLGDPERRARYNRLGPLYTPDGRPPRPDEINEALGNMVGNLFRRRRRSADLDLRYTISLTLEEVATGVERTITVPRQARCTTCGGSGAASQEACEVCGGSGRASGARLWRTACYHCDGRGYVVTASCPACGGEGRRGVEDSLVVKVPAGVATGQKLKLKGKGDEDAGSRKQGNLFVIVSVADHSLFRRRGEDVLVELPLTLHEATLGSEVAVPTLEGASVIRIPPETPHGKVFRLAGRGLPRVGKSGRGDLHVQVELEVPRRLTDEQRRTLAAWAETLSEDSHPHRARFDEAVTARRT